LPKTILIENGAELPLTIGMDVPDVSTRTIQGRHHVVLFRDIDTQEFDTINVPYATEEQAKLARRKLLNEFARSKRKKST
jgi:hypothetical protein